jgi:hypothetical protein
MTNVQVFRSELGIPLIELSGVVTERDGAELAAKIMRAIYAATQVEDGYPHPMSLREPCTTSTREDLPAGPDNPE